MDQTISEYKSIIAEQAKTIQLLTDLTRAGSWIINYAPDGSISSVQWGNGFRRLMGYTDSTDFPNELGPIFQGIYPDDREAFIAYFKNIIEQKDISTTEDFDFRFIRKDGTIRWFRSMGRITRDEDKRPVRFHGVTIDIDKTKKHDFLLSQLQNEAATLDIIHEMLGSGKWTMDFDEDGKMTQVNWSDEFRHMLGYHGLEDFPNVLESWSDLLHPEDKESVLKEYGETILDYTGKKIYDVEYRLMTKNRGYRWYRAIGKPTRRPDGSPITYVGVFIDITDRKEMMQKLSEQGQSLNIALQEANKANKAKTAFLSNMSHEMRTPMNAIIGLDSIALNDESISPKTRKYLEKIGESAHHLLGIINDVLDKSRIESGRMTIRHEEFSLARSLTQINTMINDQCIDKGLDYDCHIIGSVEDYYIGDDMKLRQIMINILGNAVKFTPKGGKVSFTVEVISSYDMKDTLRFTISDTGIGISQEFIPHIFEAFSQEDSSRTNQYGSTGLGMPITKSIVELMNGTITVASEKGKGTTFVVTVTLGKPEHQVSQESLKELHLEDLENLCVLVIDDDPVACDHAEIVLSQTGIHCEKALSGQEGLEMVKIRQGRGEPYKMVLVDWKMPGMDGIETSRQIRDFSGGEIPVIILTSFSWDDIAEEAMSVGVDGFVAKPLFPGTVMEQFRDALAKRNARKLAKKTDLNGKRILLAEDMPINTEIMLMILSMRGIQAEHAENGKLAVEMFSSHEAGYYNAILMDIRMPVMDGLEATKTIRALERKDAKEIPIIALTANAFDTDVQLSMQAGINAHLSKPIEPDTLFETLERLIH